MASIAQAIRMALHVGETQLGVEDIFGEDVGPPLGGVFTCTQGLTKSWNTPLDERGVIGIAIGLALAGQRPVAEIQFCDYIFNTIDLLKLAGNTCWSTDGVFNLPMVVMTPAGAGIHGSLYHSHSFESIAAHIPGLKIVYPSNPLDAYGLLISAIIDPNPVLYLYPKALIRNQTDDVIPGVPSDARALSKMIDAPLGEREKWQPQWPELKPLNMPLGVGKRLIEGNSLTVLSYGRHVHMCRKVIERLESADNNYRQQIELIDLRSLNPIDWELLLSSVKKTGRLLVVNEDTEVSNFGEHLIRELTERCFYYLETPPRLLAAKNTPGTGLAWTLESAQIPQEEDISTAIQDILRKKA